jgi:hypothetical protein
VITVSGAHPSPAAPSPLKQRSLNQAAGRSTPRPHGRDRHSDHRSGAHRSPAAPDRREQRSRDPAAGAGPRPARSRVTSGTPPGTAIMGQAAPADAACDHRSGARRRHVCRAAAPNGDHEPGCRTIVASTGGPGRRVIAVGVVEVTTVAQPPETAIMGSSSSRRRRDHTRRARQGDRRSGPSPATRDQATADPASRRTPDGTRSVTTSRGSPASPAAPSHLEPRSPDEAAHHRCREDGQPKAGNRDHRCGGSGAITRARSPKKQAGQTGVGPLTGTSPPGVAGVSIGASAQIAT